MLARLLSLQSVPQESSSSSPAPSTANTKSDVPGPRLTDVVRRAWLAGGFTVSSDFARANAGLVAAASSMGFITTLYGRVHDEWQHGTTWRVTPEGLALLWRELQ
jgi:hypothetical protein